VITSIAGAARSGGRILPLAEHFLVSSASAGKAYARSTSREEGAARVWLAGRELENVVERAVGRGPLASMICRWRLCASGGR
jgi:hypothetical protein